MKYESIYMTIWRATPTKSSAVYTWVEENGSWSNPERMEVSIAEGWEIVEDLKARTGKMPTYRFCNHEGTVYTVELYATNTKG